MLPALPEKLAMATDAELRRLGVAIHVGEQVSAVTATGIHTRQGRFIEAELKIWCAGIRTPEPIRHLEGLELDRMGRVVVDRELRTTRDPAIYAIGDCAEHAGTVYGLAAPALEQAGVLAEVLAGRTDSRYTGTRSLTRLTLAGGPRPPFDLAAFGETEPRAGDDVVRLTDATRGTYRKVVIRASSAIPRQIDGDAIGAGHEITCECLHGKLLVRVPR